MSGEASAPQQLMHQHFCLPYWQIQSEQNRMTSLQQEQWPLQVYPTRLNRSLLKADNILIESTVAAAAYKAGAAASATSNTVTYMELRERLLCCKESGISSSALILQWSVPAEPPKHIRMCHAMADSHGLEPALSLHVLRCLLCLQPLR